MSEVGNAFWTLLFWYGLAVVGSLIGGIGMLIGGNLSGLALLLFGGVSFNSAGASVYLGIKERSWKLLWALPSLVLPFAFVLVSDIVAGPSTGPDRVDIPGNRVQALQTAFIGLTVVALSAMAVGMRPRWTMATAVAIFSVTLSIVAFWLGTSALTHTVS